MASRPLLTILLAAVLALALTASAPREGDTDAASIHPGVRTEVADNQCTANFVVTDLERQDVYLGQAAHCLSESGLAAVTGCEAESFGIGSRVDIDGASQPGTLVYSSWITMQDVNETDADACQFNDFALIEVAEADESRVSPTIPFGGPTGLETEGTEAGEEVFVYGNSRRRGGLVPTKSGVSLGTTGGGWNHVVVTPVTPGLPGDSGSPVVTEDGRAVGVLVTLALAPRAGTNGVTDLHRALSYANAHADAGNSGLSGPVVLVEANGSFDRPGLLAPSGLPAP